MRYIIGKGTITVFSFLKSAKAKKKICDTIQECKNLRVSTILVVRFAALFSHRLTPATIVK